jgi:DNA-binding transcriptional LysR family regulator
VDELSINRAFIHVVEKGGFSAASRFLDASVTSVARQVNGLETMLGVRLLNRTTRRQSLTEAGQVYYAKITAILAQLDEAKRDVSSYQEGVKGRLKVHLRTTIGNQVIVPALPRFLTQYPNINLHLTLTDNREDLVEHSVDVAVWLGALEDSSMMARRLSPSERVVCGSPLYLQKHGAPQEPMDLAKHNCMVFEAKDYSNIWRFTRNGETVEVPVSGNLTTNSGIALITSAISGLGLALLQHSLVRESIVRGELAQVLESYSASPTGTDPALFAVYPSSRHLSPKSRAFIDFLVDLFH